MYAALREHGRADREAVRLAVLEVDGTISVVPAGSTTYRTGTATRVSLQRTLGRWATCSPSRAPTSPSTRGQGVLMFVFVASLFRLLGKRHVGSFNTYDIAMLMAASNAVQNAMTAGRGNFAVGPPCV